MFLVYQNMNREYLKETCVWQQKNSCRTLTKLLTSMTMEVCQNYNKQAHKFNLPMPTAKQLYWSKCGKPILWDINFVCIGSNKSSSVAWAGL